MCLGIIYNIMRFAIHDGPGIRTTVFFKGCPLECEWCHNPESQNSNPQLCFFENRCIRCMDCVKVCEGLGEGSVIDWEKCKACGKCTAVCPSGAREMMGRRITPQELVEEAAKDKVFFNQSGGGVTFSGGEPFYQPAFLEAALKACRQAEIHTAVDTCGFMDREVMLRISEWADLFLYDLKLIDDEKHIRYTGQSNRIILENLKALQKSGSRIWLRLPIIPGVNDGREDLEKMAGFIKEAGDFEQIQLLPYHDISREKYRRLGRAYLMEGLAVPGLFAMEKTARIMEEHGLIVYIK